MIHPTDKHDPFLEIISDLAALTQQIFPEMLAKRSITLQEYEQECQAPLFLQQELTQQARALYANRNRLKREIPLKTASYRYSKGGEMLHRGPLCPDFTEDLVVGNLRRGRLCKNKPLSPTYIYHLDKDDNLLLVQSSHATEYIIRQEDTQIGIAFNGKYPQTLCLCRYSPSGQLLQYILALLDDTAHVQEYTRCDYTYTENQLMVEKLKYHHDFWQKGLPLVDNDRYCFLVEKGYLTRYHVDLLDSIDLTHQPINQRTHPIKRKRKVDPPNEP